MKYRHRTISSAYVYRLASAVCIVFIRLLFNQSNAFAAGPIVEIDIACSNDKVYTWYTDNTVGVGNSSHLDAYQPASRYDLPAGKSPNDIVGLGIAGNDHVYAWYRDGTVSSGTSANLTQYHAPYAYSLPSGKTPSDIVGMSIACSNDHVYVWYKDGTVSSGSSDKLDKYRSPYKYQAASGKKPADIVGLGIARNDHVYAWYSDHTVSSGTTDDLGRYLAPYKYVIVSPRCDFGPSKPVGGGAGGQVSATATRGPECDTSTTMNIAIKRDVSFWFDDTLAENN